MNEIQKNESPERKLLSGLDIYTKKWRYNLNPDIPRELYTFLSDAAEGTPEISFLRSDIEYDLRIANNQKKREKLIFKRLRENNPNYCFSIRPNFNKELNRFEPGYPSYLLNEKNLLKLYLSGLIDYGDCYSLFEKSLKDFFEDYEVIRTHNLCLEIIDSNFNFNNSIELTGKKTDTFSLIYLLNEFGLLYQMEEERGMSKKRVAEIISIVTNTSPDNIKKYISKIHDKSQKELGPTFKERMARIDKLLGK